MMTTSYPHGGMPPQGMHHGHPGMGGPGPNPGQPGMPPGMQHVSGPNGPVSQAGPMMGMQPGMGPNAHAMQHLQPGQHMFQQQQMMNPAMMQQQRNAQQAYMARQQQQQAMLAQQQGGGMGMGFQNQNPMANMTQAQAQQLQAIRNGQMGQGFAVNLPPHLLQQQQQMGQLGNPQHQAAIAQAQAAHQQHQQQQQQQQQMQQQQQQHQQHAIAMQHAQSQSSNHSQTGNQGPAPTTQPQQGPLRPPSAIGSHQGQSSPAPQPTPQQQPQPPPQQPPQQQPPQSGPPPQQQTPAPAQPPNLPQQPNPQAPNQGQIQQRNPALAQQQAQAQAQASAQNARQMAMMQQKQQANAQSGGQGTLKLLNFVEQIGKFEATATDDGKKNNNVERWQAFVDKFFTETGSFIQVVSSATSDHTKQFEIVYAALPRYFYTLFNTDVTSLQITLDGATEKMTGPELKVTCDRAKLVYTYRNHCQVVYQGRLTAFWSGSDKMEWLMFDGSSHEQFIPLNALRQLFHQPSPNQMNPNQSPRMNKTKKGQQQQRAAQDPPEPYLPQSRLLSAGVTDYGLPHGLQSYLEIYEPMNHMTSLMAHYLENPGMKPSEALESWNNTMTTSLQGLQNQNHGPQQGQGMPPGARPPPGPGQPAQMFMSPALQNSLLPNGAGGSPHFNHTPSPNSQSMIKQHSTSSHTMSVNTSPNLNNKRRRSTVKADTDMDGEPNGAPKVKPSPRMGGGNKRMKAG